jgi:hypothetical protein
MDTEVDPDADGEAEENIIEQSPREVLIRKALEHGSWLVSRVLFVATLFLGTLIFETPLREIARGNVLSKYEEAERARLVAEYEFLRRLQIDISTAEVSFSDARQRCSDSSSPTAARNEALVRYRTSVERLETSFAGRTAKLEESLDEEMYLYVDLLRRSLGTLRDVSDTGLTDDNRPALQAQRELHELYAQSLDVKIENAVLHARGRTGEKK